MANHVARLLCRIVVVSALFVGSGLVGPQTNSAQACPMCKVANEQDAQLPRAYMYSILFMMGMIFSLAGSVGFGMYLMARKENDSLEAFENSLGSAPATPTSSVQAATT